MSFERLRGSSCLQGCWLLRLTAEAEAGVSQLMHPSGAREAPNVGAEISKNTQRDMHINSPRFLHSWLKLQTPPLMHFWISCRCASLYLQ